jgi:uncharacterized damage-inducible protein DinB
MPQFPNCHPDIVEGFKRESCFTLVHSRDRILHCLGQLSDEQVWWRPHEAMNAVGNLVLHVCGNMGQWIVSGCCGAPDRRDRPAEFAQRDPVAKAELIHKLNETVDDAKAAILKLDEGELLRPRHVQIAEATGMGAVFHSVSHLEGHAQEIIYITRLQLGDAYRFKNVY